MVASPLFIIATMDIDSQDFNNDDIAQLSCLKRNQQPQTSYDDRYAYKSFELGPCDLDDTTWFYMDPNNAKAPDGTGPSGQSHAYAVVSAYDSLPVTILDDVVSPASVTNIEPLGGLYGTQRLYAIPSPIVKKFPDGVFSESNLGIFADSLGLSGDKRTLFRKQKLADIDTIYQHVMRECHNNLLSFNEKDGHSALEYPINTKGRFNDHIRPLVMDRRWADKFAEASGFLGVESQWGVDNQYVFIAEMIGNIRAITDDLADNQYNIKNKYLAFEQVLRNLPSSPGSMTIGDPYSGDVSLDQEEEKKVNHALKVYDDALQKTYRQLTFSYTTDGDEEFPQGFGRQFNGMYSYLWTARPYLGVVDENPGGNQNDSPTNLFPPHARRVYGGSSHWDEYVRPILNSRFTDPVDDLPALFYTLGVQSHRATMALVLVYIDAFFGKNMVDDFVRENYQNGPKAYDASRQVYAAISRAYAPPSDSWHSGGGATGYHPDIYRARITEAIYAHQHNLESSADKDLIFQPQSGFELAYKHWPVFYHSANREITGYKYNLARERDNYGKQQSAFVRMINFLLVFDMVYGFFELPMVALEDGIDEFASEFGSAEVSEVESEMESVDDQLLNQTECF
ncbi:MAG: hypothetical protein KZQ86_03620 [Candidatus Thiodiazotropha sp. (ex Lucinoma kastoroae)]|nr:hypothetical protein [Candidatus Thiodiazotropha sp. (ex Lucinoma kastoroae)]